MSRGLVARETSISLVVNSVLVLGSNLMAFGGQDEVPVWGAGGVLFDLLPTCFICALMGSVVPSLVNRRRFTPPPDIRFILLRGLILALLAVLTLIPAATLLLRSTEVLSFMQVLWLKMLLSAFLVSGVTLWSLRGLLHRM
ncbi:MAG: hypothetical protein ACOVN0_09825 [Niveispirillum sp.]|uniref:hypothetical protein n=1 Tax=Niveispirillum sp. TaxID=1917217 RepID=UPI003BA5E1E0